MSNIYIYEGKDLTYLKNGLILYSLRPQVKLI